MSTSHEAVGLGCCSRWGFRPMQVSMNPSLGDARMHLHPAHPARACMLTTMLHPATHLLQKGMVPISELPGALEGLGPDHLVDPATGQPTCPPRQVGTARHLPLSVQPTSCVIRDWQLVAVQCGAWLSRTRAKVAARHGCMHAVHGPPPSTQPLRLRSRDMQPTIQELAASKLIVPMRGRSVIATLG